MGIMAIKHMLSKLRQKVKVSFLCAVSLAGLAAVALEMKDWVPSPLGSILFLWFLMLLSIGIILKGTEKAIRFQEEESQNLDLEKARPNLGLDEKPPLCATPAVSSFSLLSPGISVPGSKPMANAVLPPLRFKRQNDILAFAA